MKAQARKLGLNDVRINMAGCLERCELGPVMVVYPEGTWYRYESQSDIDEILQKHIVQDQQVKRLEVADGQEFLTWNTPSRQKMRVKELTHLSSSVLKVVLCNVEQAALAEFSPGAHIDLLLSDKAIKVSCWLFGDPNNQTQYIAGVPTDQVDPENAKVITDSLQVGAEVVATLPNNFPLFGVPPQNVRLFAYGSGIVPMLSALCKFKHSGVDIRLIYVPAQSEFQASKSPINPEKLLKQLEDSHTCVASSIETLNAVKLLDRNVRHQGQLKSIAELMSIQFNRMAGDAEDDRIVCISGPMSFIDACRQDHKFVKLASRCHIEMISTDMRTSDHGRSVFDIVLSRHRARLGVSENQTIIDAMNAGGYPMDYECKDGNCGRCWIKVLHGDVSHSHDAPATLKESGMAALCRSRADGSTRCLILDL